MHVMTKTSPQKLDLAAAARRLTADQRPHAQERRRFRRMPIVVGGRMLDALGPRTRLPHRRHLAGRRPHRRAVLPNVGERVVHLS